ncbi:hypothetical protein KRX51_01125 [Corynebacterium sp. TAE3-ERU12]|uniref:hypothetical protein n=1 Tax=Corynebacterium sp. TAE3-ERU12 TaxID=2849491 RepID=UPI001C493D9D|nr:hypothetical protein [Corynebacterium sp. TAE3-ERU12]MBV7294520.1 hypothetical protein [Corynebacterium sp. TAE3-ERU12]
MASTTAQYGSDEHFVEGYHPQSLNAEYSSLHKSKTWIGMGFILASLAAWGIFVFGLGVTVFDTHSAHTVGYINEAGEWVGQSDDFPASLIMWGGLALALAMDLFGFFLIHLGRKDYKEYRKTHNVGH